MQGWHCSAAFTAHAGDTGHAWVVIQGQCLGDEAIKLHPQQSAALTNLQRLNCTHAPYLVKVSIICDCEERNGCFIDKLDSAEIKVQRERASRLRPNVEMTTLDPG